MKIKPYKQVSRSLPRHVHGEAGVTLLMALLLVLIASMLAAGIIFSTQTEIWTTGNYRATTQARYVAEAGAQQAANWIINNWTAPTNLSTTTQFNLTTFPALYVGGNAPAKIVFASANIGTITDSYSGISSSADNSFDAAIVNTPFTALGSPTVKVAAELLSATQPSGTTLWQTKWKIISQASVGGVQPANVQVVEVISHIIDTSTTTKPIPNFQYAVLATGTGCNVITVSGGSGSTNAYNPNAGGTGANMGSASSTPTLLNSQGSIGSFGNISLSSGGFINGQVFSPEYNLGNSGQYGISCAPWTSVCGNNKSGYNGDAACSSSNVWAINEDNSGSSVGCTGTEKSCTQAGNVTANMPASLSSPSALPNATMPSITSNTSACTALSGGLCSGGNGGSSCKGTLAPNPSGPSYGLVTFGSCAQITLQPGVYNFDTLSVANGAQITISPAGSVVINVYNASNSSTPINYSGGTVVNAGADPNNLTFAYNGSNTINLGNGAALYATIYAPNAAVNVSGNGGLYGAVVGHTFAFTGSGHVVYDTNLANETPNVVSSTTGTALAPHLDEFSWSSF